MSDLSGDVARPSRRERRLISFLAPQLQANEQIEFILSLVREKKRKYPLWLLGPTFAVVVTNQRVFEISLQRVISRPKLILGAHARESVTAAWWRDALEVNPNPYGGPDIVGKLSITSPSGTRDLWVQGKPRKDRAQAIAAALNADRT